MGRKIVQNPAVHILAGSCPKPPQPSPQKTQPLLLPPPARSPPLHPQSPPGRSGRGPPAAPQRRGSASPPTSRPPPRSDRSRGPARARAFGRAGGGRFGASGWAGGAAFGFFGWVCTLKRKRKGTNSKKRDPNGSNRFMIFQVVKLPNQLEVGKTKTRSCLKCRRVSGVFT